MRFCFPENSVYGFCLNKQANKQNLFLVYDNVLDVASSNNILMSYSLNLKIYKKIWRYFWYKKLTFYKCIQTANHIVWIISHRFKESETIFNVKIAILELSDTHKQNMCKLTIFYVTYSMLLNTPLYTLFKPYRDSESILFWISGTCAL